LLPRADQPGRVPVNEILLAIPAAREAVAAGQTNLMPIMAGNPKIGMQTMDEAVLKRYRAGTITYETAQGAMTNGERLGEKT
ncbi:MAG: type IV pili twitching motility protein PilT, partial [Armatimonadota bacterium]|nr:type IV pili twitching motility protein PilT [Armatimonadota bacterium]